MERFLVPKPVLEALKEVETKPEETKPEKKTRRNYASELTVEERQGIVQHARDNGPTSASEKFKIPVETIHCWVKTAKKNGWKVEKQEARGRKPLLDEEQKEELITMVEKVRDAKHSLKAKKVCAIAKGLAAHSGKLKDAKYSASWAKKLLHNEGYGNYAATSDRTVSDMKIASEGSYFFEEYNYQINHGAGAIPPRHRYNMDEFLCLMMNDVSKTTWHRVSKRGNVAVRDAKEAFTCAVTTSADGDVVNLYLNWKGATQRSEAKPEEVSPLICQDHQPASHMFDEDVFLRWIAKFIEVVNERRGEAKPKDEPALLLVDHATQHVTQKVSDILRKQEIYVILIPPLTTHVFQPADQWIIAGLKRQVENANTGFIESTCAKFGPTNKSIDTIYPKSVPTLRARAYQWLAIAVVEVGKPTVISSWETCGLLEGSTNKKWEQCCRDTAQICDDCQVQLTVRWCQVCGQHTCSDDGCVFAHSELCKEPWQEIQEAKEKEKAAAKQAKATKEKKKAEDAALAKQLLQEHKKKEGNEDTPKKEPPKKPAPKKEPKKEAPKKEAPKKEPIKETGKRQTLLTGVKRVTEVQEVVRTTVRRVEVEEEVCIVAVNRASAIEIE